jgi:BatD DUF11 like domain
MYFKKFYYLFIAILALSAITLQATGSPYTRLPYKRIIADSDSAINVFIRVVSTKKAVRVGEPFMVKYTLYTAVQVIDPETNVDVKFTNCYQEEFSSDTSSAIETVNGKRYTVVALKQYLVIANNAGAVLLPQIKIQMQMYGVAANDFFAEQKLITKDIVSDPGVVTVEKLPINPDSTLFSGAVGKFRFRGSYSQAPRAKNMLLFHLIIDGEGNTKSAAIALPHFPDGLEVYNANTTRHDSVTSFGLKTRFDYTFQVVANYRGKYVVPAVVFNAYDPDRNKFVGFTSGVYNWQVDKGPQMIVQKDSAHRQANILYTEKTLYAKTNETFSYSFWYYFLLIIGVLLSLYSYLRPYFNRLSLIFVDFINGRMNKYLALRSIKKLIGDSSTVDDDVFWKRLSSILYRYIKGEAKISEKAVSDLSLDTNIFSKNIPADLYEQIVLFLSGLQSIRFSAVKSATVDKVQSCNQLITIVNALDTNWHE